MKEIEIKYKESRRRARLNWAHSEHGKEVTKNYMKDYRRLPHNKEKAHEYYVKNKAHWGEITKAKERKKNNWGGFRIKSEDIAQNHYEWCKDNGYDSSWYKNDTLNAVNSKRFVDEAKNKEKDLQEIYNKIFDQTIKHMKKYEPQMVAGTLMAIAIRLYKTSLSDDGFSEMLQTVLDAENDIKPYKEDKETIH